MARPSTTRSAGSSTGLAKNCSAPSFIARTARSMLAWAVRMSTGSVGSALRSWRSRSKPSPSGSVKSSSAASGGLRRAASSAAATPSASSTS
jgi:hypothetical protein